MLPQRPIHRIIIVDDDDDDEFLLKWTLRKAGVVAPILGFKGGQAVIDHFVRHGAGFKSGANFAGTLLFLDLKMPGGSGISVLSYLQGIPAETSPLVVVLSASHDPVEKNHAAAFAGTLYREKPLTAESFSELVLAQDLAWEPGLE